MAEELEEAARSILNEARARGIVVPDESSMVESARVLLELAQDAHDNGAQGEDVMAILAMKGLLNGEVAGGHEEPATEEPIDTPSQQEDGPQEATESPRDAPVRKGKNEQFPIPPEIEGLPPEMPRDLTELSDRDVRRLQGEFNAWLNRVTYLIGVERSDEVDATAQAESALRKAKAKARVELTTPEGKAPAAAQVNTLAEESDEYQEWTMRATGHKAELVRMYALRDIYQHNIERLAYDWKARSDLWRQGGTS